MHRTSINGSYRLDRVFPGVGRIAVASGATTREEFKKRNALLTRLYDQGRLDLLRAIAAHTYTVTEVYAADREGRLDGLSGVGLSTPKVFTPRSTIHLLADSPSPGNSLRYSGWPK